MNKYVDLIGRILLALMFFISGLTKIGSYAATQGYMESQGVPGILLPLVIILEVGASVAVVIGWQTRLAAWALAGFCVLTALLFHLDFGDQMQTIMLMKNLSIAGGCLILAAMGAGELSLDHRRARQA